MTKLGFDGWLRTIWFTTASFPPFFYLMLIRISFFRCPVDTPSNVIKDLSTTNDFLQAPEI